MPLSLGLDTGGTYTDAVIFDDAQGKIIAKAKALTTRHDLAIGISEAARKVLDASAAKPADIDLVSISTTLATNALVEGQGGRAGLVMIGFEERDLDKAGLRAALGDDPVIFMHGGHNVHGRANALELDAAKEELLSVARTVSSFAVVGYFAVRNPEHELAVRDYLIAQTNRPVTCSHELSSKLDGPRRALTTLLNARLIDMIGRLISATQSFLTDIGIDCPLMIVRGDGSLVSAQFAHRRPIETILSGPAASLVGARFITQEDNAIVADIGGTTTDIAVLEDGRPLIDEGGALVGGYRTMVEAVAMRTFGLGGDSQVTIDEGALEPQIHLGPRRVVPLSLLAQEHEATIIVQLERQMRTAFPGRHDGRFALRTRVPEHLAAGLAKSEAALFERLGEIPIPLETLLKSTSDNATLDQLVRRGLAQISAITPSDAQHVLGNFSHWNAKAAVLGLELFARRKDGYGKPLAASADDLARRIVNRLIRLSAHRVLETGFAHDGLDGPVVVNSPIVQRALNRDGQIIRTALMLDRPIIGLGAGASAYYPQVSALLGAAGLVPTDADVANAIGAVVGKIRLCVTIEVLSLENGLFKILGGAKSATMEDEARAMKAAHGLARETAMAQAKLAGAENIAINVNEDIKSVMLEDQRKFISAMVTAIATGRPHLG